MVYTAHPALAAYLSRLELHSPLGEPERQAVLSLPAEEATVAARRDLVRPGEIVRHALLVADGLLGRFDTMRNGARQITALHIPGDMCDLHSVVAPLTGWGITALCGSKVLHVGHEGIRAAAAALPELATAFWRDTTLDASILAKGVANIGRKSARARIAHLFCEMGVRSERAGQGERSDYPLDLIQEQIGDVVGLTGVHVNRSIQALRDEELLEVKGRRVRILDWSGLAAVAEFSPAYLLRDERAALPA